MVIYTRRAGPHCISFGWAGSGRAAAVGGGQPAAGNRWPRVAASGVGGRRLPASDQRPVAGGGRWAGAKCTLYNFRREGGPPPPEAVVIVFKYEGAANLEKVGVPRGPNLSKTNSSNISIELCFLVDLCFQNQGLTCSREDNNPSKH